MIAWFGNGGSNVPACPASVPIVSTPTPSTSRSRASNRDARDYINLRDDGPHTPGWSKECSQFLAQERDVLGVGVETVGTDAGRAGTFDPPFSNHYIMHGSGRFGLAGLCNLDLLPATGAVVIAAPLKIAGGSGSPVRAIAITA